MKYFFICTGCLIFFLVACSPEQTTPKKHHKNKVKLYLDHEILNDSIHYKIKEFKKRNHILRKICVFNRDELLKERTIYKVQKKLLLDEGYNTSFSRMYQTLPNKTIREFNITTHYFNYKIESIDTTLVDIRITPNGNLSLTENRH